MRRPPEIELPDLPELDVDDFTPSPHELGLPVDFVRPIAEDDLEELGLRSLYEHPEAILRSRRWRDAA